MSRENSPQPSLSGSEVDPAAPQRARRFSAFLIGRPVTVFTLFLSLLGLGTLAFQEIPLTFAPSGIGGSSFTVFLPFPGAGPAEVEDQIARPVEEQLRTIPGVTEILTRSTEGSARVSVTFSNNTDMDVAYGEVRDRLERIRPSLPQEMDRYRIMRFSIDNLPILWMGIRYDGEEAHLQLIERIALPRIEGADGVAAVDSMGIVEDSLRIFVDVDKAAGYGLDLGIVIRALREDNFTLPAGHIDAQGRTFNVRIDNRFRSIEDVANYPVAEGIVLSDIAEIRFGKALRDSVWRIKGQQAVGVAVSKESGRNTIEVSTEVERVVSELQRDPRFADVSFDIFWSQKEDILRSIKGLRSSAIWGGLFALLVLWVFLRDLRLTLIAALAIPASLLTALTALYFNDMTLNMVSLAGFTLAMGMLVDNAVVVIESISRKRSQEPTARAAAAHGASEVSLAILTATLTTIVVFLPLVFMDAERNIRIIIRELGLPITFSLTASLLVAMVFIPSFTAQFLRRDRGDGPAPHVSEKLLFRYRQGLRWALQHRFGTFILLLLVVNIGTEAAKNLDYSLSGNEDMGQIRAAVDLPSSFTLNDANDVFRELESWAEEQRDSLGFDFYSCRFDRRGGEMNFYPRDDLPPDKRRNFAFTLRGKFPEFPGVNITIGWQGAGQTAKETRLILTGPDFGVLTTIANDVKQRLEVLTRLESDGSTPLVFDDVRTDIDEGLDEVQILVDRDRAAALGVSPESLQGTVAWGLSGQRLPDLQLGEREIPMAIEYGHDEAEGLDFLRNLPLFGANVMGVVPLSALAEFRFGRGLGQLIRHNGLTSLGITARPSTENVYEVDRLVATVIDDTPIPEGYGWVEEGGRQDFEADMAVLGETLGLSIILVYLLMAILLESVVLPFCILLTFPLALIGVFLTLSIFSIPIDVMVMMGLILLSGVVVNNAIVLLDRVGRLQRSGVDRTEALIQGGGDRLRPILMTALTTIFGLLPMALPHLFPGTEGDSGYSGLAFTIAGGLAFSTLLTLIIVPWAYSLLDDLGGFIADLLPWGARSQQLPPSTEST